jgi:hypothetical protein
MTDRRTKDPTPDEREELVPVRRWPGSGWVEAGEVVAYGSVRWLCLARTCGKPTTRATAFWKKLD